MGKNTLIEWTNHTFNPWIGCTKVSPGCFNCYAWAMNLRFAEGANWGKGAPRRRTSVHNWNEPRRWERAYSEELNKFEGHKALHGGFAHYPEPRRPRVFCASLADWLDDGVPIEWLADLLDLIRQTPNLDWLLLTKRPENWSNRLHSVFGRKRPESNDEAALCGWILDWINGEPPKNVWIGTTVEDQIRAVLRIPQLLVIPAKIRFLSCEPLLGPVDIWKPVVDCSATIAGDKFTDFINWVICGGESGAGARPMHPDWARSLRDQCHAGRVPFFFKQWGNWTSTMARPAFCERADAIHAMTIDGSIRPCPNRELHSGEIAMVRRATKEGSQLDGREWKEFPKA